MSEQEPSFDVDPEERFGWAFYERIENLGMAVFVLRDGDIVQHDGHEEVLRLDAEDAERLARVLRHAAEYVADEFVDVDDEDEANDR